VCRQPAAVADDVALGRITAAEAAGVYGVVIDGDGQAVPDDTEARREEIRRRRLAGARPAARPLAGAAGDRSADGAGDGSADGSADGSGVGWGGAAGVPAPLYPGVAQRGRVAVSERSGAPLAVAPDHWTDGCPVLEERRRSGNLTLVVEAYLDPVTGHALCVDVRPEGAERTFTTLPTRWVTA
jgi:N-methylhydantoinase B